MNLLDVLDLHGEHLHYKRALSDDAGSATYGELSAAITGVAGAFQRQGIGPGEIVAIACDPSIPAVVAMLALQKMGAVAAPVNLRLAASEISSYIRQIDPSLVIADRVLADQTAPVLRVAGAGASGSIRDRMALRYEPLLPVSLDERAPAMAFPTGGTTGSPKAALWSQRGLFEIVVSNSVNLGVRRSDLEIYIAALAHVTVISGLFPTLYMGGTTHVMSRFEGAAAAALFESLAPSRILTTPTAFSRILDCLADRPERRPEEIRITYGAAGNSPDFRQRTLDAFPNAQLITGYGATEFGPVARMYSDDPEANDAGALGHPVPGVSIRVMAADGTPVEPGDTGEIVVRAPWQMIGYLGIDNPFTADGAIRTGDVGWVNERGCFFLSGRSKELIKTGGENVYPKEVEDVIQTHPSVLEAGVYGIDDPLWGERVEAAVVVSSAVEAAALRRYCSERLAGFKVPKRFIFVDSLPVTANMKLDRRRLTQQALVDEQSSGTRP